uniref:Uncharacterized protein n=1 Tax=Anopheles triannulatus TaxID=58253 RepID=A0A2M4ALP5_9DIPT
MCKKVAAIGNNSLLLDNNKRVRSFFRKPRYTHFCSVWYIIEGRSGTRKTVPHGTTTPTTIIATAVHHHRPRKQAPPPPRTQPNVPPYRYRRFG